MSKQRSPFIVIEDFISPLRCEDLIDLANFTTPDTTKEGKNLCTSKLSEPVEQTIFGDIRANAQQWLSYYDSSLKYKGTERIHIEWIPEASAGVRAHAENSEFLNQKWARTQARDLTGVLFLMDYSEDANFDPYFEVYGGKLEFPQHGFGFNPKRGTAVVFPSDPHFINLTTPVQVGELFQIRFHISATTPYIYDPKQFPGTYKTWF